MTPRPTSLNPNMVAVKVDNRMLYSGSWSWFLHDFLQTVCIVPVSITRVDLAMDFQRFKGGLLPNDFIAQYISSGQLADGNKLIRRGSNNFSLHGFKKLLKDEELGAQEYDRVETHFDYLRFGSRESGVCVYLYNKTQELKDGKAKPWIQDLWKECGVDEEEDLPVYRLEFSISSKAMRVLPPGMKKADIKLNPDCLYRLSLSNFQTQTLIEQVFWSYADKYFKFHIATGVKYRKDMPFMDLFDIGCEPTLKPVYLSSKFNSGESERRAAKCLDKLLMTYTDMSDEQYHKIEDCEKILREIYQLKQSSIRADVEGLETFAAADAFAYDKLKAAGIVTEVQRTLIRKAANKEAARLLEKWNSSRLMQQFITEEEVAEMLIEELAAAYDDAISDYYSNV